MKFEYPIDIKNRTPETILGQNNMVGTYPIGYLFNWHGGLHMQEWGRQPIRSIADGVVIAYRIAEKPIEIGKAKISNSFVLVRHKYVSPGGRELVFYSLYNHLMAYEEMNDIAFNPSKTAPVFLQKKQFEVKGDGTINVKGLYLRSSSNKSNTFVVPKDSIVQLNNNLTEAELSEDHWAHDTPYKKVVYTNPYTGEVINDHFVHTGEAYCEKLNDSTYKIIASGAKSRGENIKNVSDGNVKFIVANGTLIEVDGFVDTEKKFYKIKKIGDKEYDGLKIWAASLVASRYPDISEPKAYDSVVTSGDCNIPIKAGDVLGFAGFCGFKGQEEYRTSHVEIFTDKDPSEFLKGKKGDANDDTKNSKSFYKIEQGASLTLKYPIDFIKGDEIKVLEYPESEDEIYCQIKLHKQTRDVYKDDLFDHNAKYRSTGKWYYTPLNIETLNKQFGDTLSKETILLLEQSLDDEAKTGKKRRRVYYWSECNKPYSCWVKKTDAQVAGITAETTDVKLSSDLNNLYFLKPGETTEDENLSETLVREISSLDKDAITIGNNKWIKIEATKDIEQENGIIKKEKIEGYIQSDDQKVTKISAFDWEAFGFKVYNSQPDTFIFDNEKGKLDKDKAPDFLKAAWQHIDEDGNSELSSKELGNALKNVAAQRKLSKMVCYHQSEWGVDFNNLKTEIEKLLGNCEPETKDLIIKTAEEKVKAFNFWSEIKVPMPEKISGMPDDWVYDPIDDVSRKRKPWETPGLTQPTVDESKEEEYIPFPKSNKVYHFHPIAFVEQMKKLPSCFCNRDITVEAFEEIFGKGPWFVGKLGIVDMQRDYPDVYNISTKKLVQALNQTMKKYGINTCLQKAHFLGQIGAETGFQFTAECADGADYDVGSHKALHESYVKFCEYLKKYSGLASSANFIEHEKKINSQFEKYKKAYEKYNKATSEQKLTDEYKKLKEMHDKYPTFKTEKEKFDSIYANSFHYSSSKTPYQNWTHSYSRYSTCIKYGNTEVGDGKKYRGHGLLQLTWKNNYIEFKKRLKIDVVSNSELLSSDIKNACNMAGSWWRNPLTGAGDLNKRADIDDMIYVAYGINGGVNGLAHRYKYTRKAVDSLGCKGCSNYKHLELGNYKYENSKIKDTKYGRENKKDIITIIEKAKNI